MTNAVATPKSREDYLKDLQATILSALQDLYKSTNKSLATVYALLLLVVLFSWEKIQKINFMGNEIPVSGTEAMLLLPVLSSILYIVLAYELIQIARMCRELDMSSEEITTLNPAARPLTIRDIDLFGVGVTGLILSLARWQARSLTSNTPVQRILASLMSGGFIQVILESPRLIVATARWMTSGAFRLLATLVLFLLPAVVMNYYQYVVFFAGDRPVTLGVSLFAFVFNLVVLIVVIISGLVLFASYLEDLLNNVLKDLTTLKEQGAEELTKTIDLAKVIVQVVSSVAGVLRWP